MDAQTSDPGHVIILAAGRGTRAGGPKALINVGGQPWWKRQAAHLAGAGRASTWVVSERVREGMGPAQGLRFVVSDESSPMFASICAGLRSLAEEQPTPKTVFVLPVDVPVPDERTLDALLGALARRAEASAAVPTHQGKHGHPVCLPWWFVAEDLLRKSRGPEARLDYLIEGRTLEVAVPDSAVIANLNTAEDFARWHAVQA